MYLKAKDYDELLPEEGPDPASRWGLVFNGVVNAYGNKIRAITITHKGFHIPFTARLVSDCTNNMAEYEPCMMGLEDAIDLRIKILDVYGDSTLVVNHIKGEWETYHPGLIPYKYYAKRLLTFFNKIEFRHIPCEENQMEDALATLSSMYQKVILMLNVGYSNGITLSATVIYVIWFQELRAMSHILAILLHVGLNEQLNFKIWSL
ncbi:uncharacterized protein LOC127136457 [Lathyrus oleraceus]|uniref:uncharacterized protein LOC127136457 n=1 Tax=Pisum sativum TaxID=3888 RepID=UPI0021D03E0B|nr:uncharacterized protein LOC127136457 [Pisum sativum]